MTPDTTTIGAARTHVVAGLSRLDRCLPRIGPAALYGLLFTVVILFALQGDAITSHPWDVALAARQRLFTSR
jgi:ACR3 family arsenite efflux pump ArsB